MSSLSQVSRIFHRAVVPGLYKHCFLSAQGENRLYSIRAPPNRYTYFRSTSHSSNMDPLELVRCLCFHAPIHGVLNKRCKYPIMSPVNQFPDFMDEGYSHKKFLKALGADILEIFSRLKENGLRRFRYALPRCSIFQSRH